MSAIRHRFESFGGILAMEDPPMLVHVDRDFMRSLGHSACSAWQESEESETQLLSAPLEVHLSVTNACSQRCGHCYMDSGKNDAGELSSVDLRRAIDLLAEMGVFHIALGGGEALERPDFFELAAHARARGMVPNLTTNGTLLTREAAERCRVFGQVNVSLDSLDGGAQADRAARLAAVDLLREAGIRVGINCVVTRKGVDGLANLIAFAKERGLVDVELLRLKPSGRGKKDYFERRLTPAQNKKFFPFIRDLSLLHGGFPVKIDCSFVPMFCWHRPDKSLMEQFSVYGCEAGNVLLGVRSDGRFAGCSFLSSEESIFELPELWRTSKHLTRLRGWIESAPEPCRSCDYRDICKGGCRAVAAVVAGDAFAPDPECPFAVAMSERETTKREGGE
jgi:radical SAM protein with 4Fe4S-binding SPASM domain